MRLQTINSSRFSYSILKMRFYCYSNAFEQFGHFLVQKQLDKEKMTTYITTTIIFQKLEYTNLFQLVENL